MKTIVKKTLCLTAALSLFWAMACKSGGAGLTEAVNAETPVINTQPAAPAGSLFKGDSISLQVSASSSDGGSLSYQWYSAAAESNLDALKTDGDASSFVLNGETGASCDVDTSAEGTFYYAVKITNSIDDNGDGGKKTAFTVSKIVKITLKPAESSGITFTPPGAIPDETIGLSLTGDAADGSVAWLTENLTATVSDAAGYTTFKWYVDGVDVTGSDTDTDDADFAMPAKNWIPGDHVLTVVVTKGDSEYSKSLAVTITHPSI